jgi:hypothetical protein
MSDAVLAAIIAATATLSASFLQLRMALARDADARSRGQPISRRRGRVPMILIGIMLLASAVGGFALSQWLGDSQRSQQADLQRELRERMAELTVAVTALERLHTAALVPAMDPLASGTAPPPDAPAAADAPRPVVPTTAADAPPMVAQSPVPAHTP